jgi:hypothetical protein
MKPKSIKILIVLILAFVILLIAGNVIIKDKTERNIFTAEQVESETSLNSDIKNSIKRICKTSGAFLIQTENEKISYFILDGSHINLKGEAPYFTNVKFETKEDSVMIYFNEEVRHYPEGKYPEQRLIYKIIKDKDYEYNKLFKNGELTHFTTIGS